jgi:hypothetical protein
MSQNIKNIKIICPDCFGHDGDQICETCDGASVVPFSSIIGLDELADCCVEDYYTRSVDIEIK